VPTVLRVDGYRFFFFSNERSEPSHIHVQHGTGHAKFWLDPVILAVAQALNPSELRRAKLFVIQYRHDFLERWHEHFGA
jgi:hypothetical protein